MCLTNLIAHEICLLHVHLKTLKFIAATFGWNKRPLRKRKEKLRFVTADVLAGFPHSFVN